jgi:hypothetical protein
VAFINNIINTLGSIIGYLNSNSGLIAAIATVVLVGITWRYVRLTDSLLKATYKPQIVVSLRTYRGDRVDWYRQGICVTNAGVGVARKIEFEGDLSFSTGDGIPLDTIDFIRDGIDALAPGDERTRNITKDRTRKNESVRSIETDRPFRLVLVTVTYMDVLGVQYNDKFTLNFNDVSIPS